MAEETQQYQHEHLEAELDDLKRELEHFEKEKERIRAIVGQIGGAPKSQVKLVNALFIIVLLVTVAISIVADEKWRLIKPHYLATRNTGYALPPTSANEGAARATSMAAC